jgi:hypothetical protein
MNSFATPARFTVALLVLSGASDLAPAGQPTWTPIPTGTTASVIGIWGASPDEVFAVGGEGVFLRYDGEEWLATSIEGTPHLVSLWGSAADDVFATGDGGLILHWDGGRWVPSRSGREDGALDAVWGSGPPGPPCRAVRGSTSPGSGAPPLTMSMPWA